MRVLFHVGAGDQERCESWFQPERLSERSRGQRPRESGRLYAHDPEGVEPWQIAGATLSGSKQCVAACPGAALRLAPGYFRRPLRGRQDYVSRGGDVNRRPL